MAQVNTEGNRQRKTAVQAGTNGTPQKNGPVVNGRSKVETSHPAGPPKHGGFAESLRIVLFGLYFFGSCLFIHGAQLLGAPLYFINRDYFYAYMAMTKQHFGLLITTMTQWWSPTVVRVSGDASMAGQLKQLPDGRIECDFPERLILIANHQIYTDWLYLWWIAYTSGMHGHIFIILKKSLKWVPLMGPAMQFYGFIFMSRKWAADQKAMAHGLQQLNSRHSGPMSGGAGASTLDPMWLLIFPEGTNLSANTRGQSRRWADKTGIPDLKHALLPRSMGFQFCLQQLKNTVEYVYDCTIAYEHIPEGQYGQDIFTLRSVYFQGRAPKSVNMYWRRFKVADMPMDDTRAMEQWILDRWREKDLAMAHHAQTGRFPADTDAIGSGKAKEDMTGFIETEVMPRNPFEFLQMFMPVLAVALIGKILVKMVNMVTTGKMSDA